MNKKLSYILNLRNSLKEELRNMPLFQNGSAIIAVNDKGQILLEERTDRNLWCIPGGLQELGETFEDVAIRELEEETGLKANKKDLVLISVVSGESRKNSYPNGDQVYNNTVLYAVNKYTGNLDCSYEELTDNIESFEMHKESKQLKFFDINNLPNNLMDKDLINVYIINVNSKI
jgi:8-oxo-dGTP pyrophosphatase MutT (NUDIX family)